MLFTLGLLAACGQPAQPKPQTNISNPIGTVGLQIYVGKEQGENLPVPDENRVIQKATTRSSFPSNSDIGFSQVSYTMRVYGNPERWFFTANFKVTNNSVNPIQNLSLFARNRSTTDIGGTALTSMIDANNQAITDIPTARNFEPSNYLSFNDNLVNAGKADFQAFTETEATQIKAAAIANGIPLTSADTILNYGFVTRKSNTSRVIPAASCKTTPTDQCNVGNVSVTFKAPAFLIAGVFPSLPLKLTYNFLLSSETNNRVTRAEETTASAIARAQTLGATEVALVGSDTDVASPLTTIRIPVVKTFVVPDAPIATIGTTGGYAKLGGFIADVPNGALPSNATFTLEKPTTIPATFPTTSEFALTRIPSAQVVSTYKITSSIPEFLKTIIVAIPIDIAYVGNADDFVTELYRWDGTSYTTIRIDRGATYFVYEPIRFAAAGDTFVAVRASLSAVIADCTTRAGFFNGSYCELPFDNAALAGQSQTRARTNDQYRMVSFNVGNALRSGPYNEIFYCGSLPGLPLDEAQTGYVYKLCSYAVERYAREAMIQDGVTSKIDLLALQELWNNDCSSVIDQGPQRIVNTRGGAVSSGNRDRVCAVPPSSGQSSRQIDRLVPTALFDNHCSPIRSFPNSPRLSKTKTNGYECVAIRKQHFEFTDPEFSIPTIQPACPGATENTTVYYKGSDTGFQVERVRLKGALGAVADAQFDFINSHMVSPPNLFDPQECRRSQLNALYVRYRTGINPKPIRVLIAGDMNTDPTRDVAPNDNDSVIGARSYFNRIFATYNTPVNTQSDTSIKMAYVISNPTETTATILAPASLDHVISNFADAPAASNACIRRDLVAGTDHQRTVCTLTGFDSGKVQAGMQVLDLSDPDPLATYNVWTSGIVTAARRSINLSYVKTTGAAIKVSTGLASSLPTELTYKACNFGSSRIRTNTVNPGAFLTNGTLLFTEFLPC